MAREIELQMQLLDRWDRPTTVARRRSIFRVTWSNTMELLQKELRLINAKFAYICINASRDDIRNDGWIRASANVKDPRVKLFLRCKYGELAYYCDEFTDWQANVRGIALTLERLRMAELYGATKRGEQYTGFAALPPPVEGAFASVEAAAEFVVGYAGTVSSDALVSVTQAWREAYRTAAKMLHPDAGGPPELFKKLQQAKEMLDKHHGV